MDPLISYAMSYCPTSDDVLGLSSATWSVVTGISSFAIAVIAVVFTWRQLKLSHKHNRLTVLPYLTAYMQILRSEGLVELSIKNTGIGPARIKNYKIIIDGNRIKSEDPVYSAADMLDEGEVKSFIHGGLCSEMFLSSEETTTILSFQLLDPDRTQEFYEKLRRRLQLTVNYQSIYEENFDFDLQKGIEIEYQKNHSD